MAENSQGQWKMQAYGPDAQFTAPSWAVKVKVRALTEWQLAHKMWNKHVQSNTVPAGNPINSVSLVGAGTTATAAASTNGNHNVVYEFLVEKPGSSQFKWVRSYSSKDSYTLPSSDTKAGTYKVEVRALTATEYKNQEWGMKKQSKPVDLTVKAGAPAAVKLSAASSSLVADGKATDTITATVVDKNGNVVKNYNGTATVSDGQGLIAAATSAGDQPSDFSSNTITFKDGVATFDVGAANTANVTDTITATPTDSSISSGNTQISTTAPVATSVGFVKPQSVISDNSATTVNLAVLDQLGNPMPSGAYTATVSVSGPATLNGGASEVVGLGPTGSVSVSPLGQTGSVTLTATVSGLASGSTTMTLATPGTASQLSATPAQTTAYSASTAAAWSSQEIATVQAEDANGLAVAAPSSAPTASVTYNGSTATDLTASASAPSPSGAFTVSLSHGTGDVKAGTYEVKVTDGSLSTTIPVVIDAGTASSLTVTPTGTTDVLASNPTTTVSAQLVDSQGNPVAESGVPVTFTSDTTKDTLSGGSGTSGSMVVDTNASGEASVTVDALASGGTVTAAAENATPTTGAINVVGAYATSVSASVSYGTGNTSYVAGSDSGLTITGKALDSSGNPVSGDSLSVKITGPNGYDQTGTLSGNTVQWGSHTGEVAYPTAPGTYSVVVTDTSVPSQPSATTSFTVTAGALHGFALFDASGNDLSTATSNDTVDNGTTTKFTVAPVDVAGNPVSADASYTVSLPTVTGYTWDNASGAALTNNKLSFSYGQGAQTVELVNASGNNGTIGANSATLSAALSGVEVANAAVITGGSGNFSATSAPSYADTATGAETYTVKVEDSNGNALANQTVYLSLTGSPSAAAGSLSSEQLVTNSNGEVTFTWAPPAHWTTTYAGDTNTITVKVGKVSPVSSTLTISE